MPLKAGDRVGGYEISALLGAGGMGEVYRARDARLGRDVAIKILSPAIASDADGLMRFEREARMLASLNHPNIAAIYGVEDGAGHPALILELVEGETLADRIARTPIPFAEVLTYARQIADALDTAHESGIVHRDLKPANIKITEGGTIKVLDFGLAKAIAAAATPLTAVDPSRSPTVTVHGTKHGVILGTVAYMSPEQARGKAVDKRTDIWAFGCVLFEMLTGRMTFSGETTSDVIAAIIEREPDWSKLPRSVPSYVRRVLERCLEKDPKRRARDIADVRVELDQPAEVVESALRRRSPVMAILALAAVSAIAIGAVAVLRWPTRSAEPTAPVEFTLGPPPDHTLVGSATVSPDGRQIAFLARNAQRVSSLWIRPLDAALPRPLEGTDGAISAGIWSPDGGSLAFRVGETWKRISADGGPVVTIVSGVVADLGASWGPDDTILMAPANRAALSRVAASGGAFEPVTTLDPATENSHRWPQILPDGRHFLFTTRSDRPANLGIKVGAFGSPEVRSLVNMPSPGRYAPPGWLLFMTPDRVLMAQPLAPTTWTLSGAPQPVAAPVRYSGSSFSGAFDVSRDGRVLVYTPGSSEESTLVWADRAGKVLGTVTPRRDYLGVRLVSTGRTIAVELPDERYGTRDIWLVDVATNALTRLTTNPATDWRPVFSPDGGTLVFASDRAGVSTLYRVATTGAGGDTLLYRHPKGGVFPVDWSRDGRYVLAQVDTDTGRPTTLLSVPVDGGPPVTLIENDQASVMMARLSPEGDRIAFISDAAGSREIYVMSIADKRRIRVSADGGWHPMWGRDGSELFFQTPRGQLMQATLGRGPLSLAAPPVEIFRPCESEKMLFSGSQSDMGYDVTADGTRFVVMCVPPEARPSTITVVVNWQSKLR
ncbi:MAG: protein kinase [Vicinamibacterales bacterium]